MASLVWVVLQHREGQISRISWETTVKNGSSSAEKNSPPISPNRISVRCAA